MTVRPPIPVMPLSGGCVCGAARYRITARPKAVNACHCLDCKRQSGADAGIFLHQDDGSAVLEQGEVAVYRKTADSGRYIDVVRCAVCGTRLWHKPLALPTLTLVAAGTLDDSSWAIPTSHIWMTRASGATAIAGDAITFDLAAPDRQLLWDRFAQIYPQQA